VSVYAKKVVSLLNTFYGNVERNCMLNRISLYCVTVLSLYNFKCAQSFYSIFMIYYHNNIMTTSNTINYVRLMVTI